MESFRYNSGNTLFSYTSNFRKNISTSQHQQRKKYTFNKQNKLNFQKIMLRKRTDPSQRKIQKIKTLNASGRNSQSQLNTYLCQQKLIFHQHVNNGKNKLKRTFRGFLNDTLKYQQVQRRQQKLLSSKNTKIQVSMTSKKIIQQNQTQGRERVTHFVNIDTFKKQNNLFNIQIKSSTCYDSVFPLSRIGSTLISNQGQIYLYGGVVSKTQINSFHKYNEVTQRWNLVKQLKNQLKNQPGVFPKFQNFGSSYHTSQVFKNYILFIGGMIMNLASQKKRAFNSQICTYDIQKQEWSQLKWDRCLRSHATTIYANILIVYGGINQRDEFVGDLAIISLNSYNFSQSRVIPWNYGRSQNQGLAYHKMVNTYDVDITFKNSLQIDGIIVYGGKYSNGQLNNHLSILRFNRNKQSGKTQILSKGWEHLDLIGKSPEDRYEHSFNILNNKGICILVGGINKYQEVLSDVWILDLCNSTWVQAIFDFQNTILSKGICSHAATSYGSQLLIYGGLNQDKMYSNAFWSIDSCLNRAKLLQAKNGKTDAVKSKKVIKNFSIQTSY